jgi:hypothetical protein
MYAALFLAVFKEWYDAFQKYLQAEGFSEEIIDRFFRPFLGGIFFNTQLTTSSRWARGWDRCF